MSEAWKGPLRRVDEFRYDIPKEYMAQMRTDGRIFADEVMIQRVAQDFAPEQVANVATMPGIVGYAMGMPDIHWGYGMPVGGVAAFDAQEGVISPGAVGFDINCGVRLLRTDLKASEIQGKIKATTDAIFRNVPSGVGSEGRVDFTKADLIKILDEGARYVTEKGYGWERDLERIEENGSMKEAESGRVSARALARGVPQLGSLGAGNHFLEIQRVERIFDEEKAKVFGITGPDQVCIMIHTGSRGCGHQIATDYIRECEEAIRKYKIELPDRQLACAPVGSPEGTAYYSAMCAGANYAFANRQMITHWVRQSFEQVLGESPEAAGMDLVYDVPHNMAKLEEHPVDGQRRKLYIHRKGATRAFGPGDPALHSRYRESGQPVLIPGDMGTASYLLAGAGSLESWGSTCHGAGRLMSRKGAMREFNARDVVQKLEKKGIYVHAASKEGIVEEAPGAYKNVDDVVRIAEGAGLSKRVVRLVPLGVVKG